MLNRQYKQYFNLINLYLTNFIGISPFQFDLIPWIEFAWINALSQWIFEIFLV